MSNSSLYEFIRYAAAKLSDVCTVCVCAKLSDVCTVCVCAKLSDVCTVCVCAKLSDVCTVCVCASGAVNTHVFFFVEVFTLRV